jgi:hypothetical protein
MPSLWVCLGLALAVGAALMAAQPGIQALAVLALALLCQRAFRRRALVPLGHSGFAALLLLAASSALGVATGIWDARGAAGLAVVIAVVQAGGYAARVVGLSARLQAVVDSLEDVELLALLPADAAAEAQRWMAGAGCDAGRLALAVRLAALHVAQRRCDAHVHGRRALLQG